MLYTQQCSLSLFALKTAFTCGYPHPISRGRAAGAALLFQLPWAELSGEQGLDEAWQRQGVGCAMGIKHFIFN